MSRVTVIPAGGGEVVGDAPHRRVEILSDRDPLHATWARLAPRGEGADLHVHRRHTDLFYVLEGELTVRLGLEDRSVAAPAGTLALVPPLVVHGFRNAADAELRYLNFHAPGVGFADYMRAPRDGRTLAYDQEPPPADGGRPTADAVIAPVGPKDGVVLLADVEAIAVAEAQWNTDEPPSPPHRHADHVESLYVLEGELTFTVDGREQRAPTGTWVQVPPGVEHALAPFGAAPVRLLDVHTPSSGFGAYLRALGDGRVAAAVALGGFEPRT